MVIKIPVQVYPSTKEKGFAWKPLTIGSKGFTSKPYLLSNLTSVLGNVYS